MREKLSIKNWAKEDRPREKLLLKGIHSLTDAELIAILIGSGNKKQTAVELSQKILQSVDNNLNELGRVSIDYLIKNFDGIGEAKAVCINAALELGRRRKAADILKRNQIKTPQDVFELFYADLADLDYEEFWALLLNQSSKIIGKFKISQGGIAGTLVDIKLLVKLICEKLASSLIVCHNHPSGNLTPSEKDIALTKKITKACSYVDCKLLDHIIITSQSYTSFVTKNLL